MFTANYKYSKCTLFKISANESQSVFNRVTHFRMHSYNSTIRYSFRIYRKNTNRDIL